MLGLFRKPWTPKYQKLLRAWCGTGVLVSPKFVIMLNKFRLCLIVWALLYEFAFGWLIKHSNQSINLSHYNLHQHSTHGGLYRPSYVYFNLLDVSLCDLIWKFIVFLLFWTLNDARFASIKFEWGPGCGLEPNYGNICETHFVSYTRTFGMCFCAIWY